MERVMELSEADWTALAGLRLTGQIPPESREKLVVLRYIQATHRGYAVTGAGNEALTRHKLGLRPSVEADEDEPETEEEPAEPAADDADQVDDDGDADAPALDGDTEDDHR